MTPWIDASKDFPCRGCGKKDWCSYNSETHGWVCMRAPNTHPTKNGGYWYPDGEHRPTFIPKPPPPEPEIDAGALMRDWAASTPYEQVVLLAHNLGVSPSSLANIGIVWARPPKQKHGWGFPMWSGQGRCIGVRLRYTDGRKSSVLGGREGVLLPHGRSGVAYIVEGPTNLAAAVTLGLWGIGRPSCRSGVAHTQVTINRLRIERAIIIADNDIPKDNGRGQLMEPGQDGAKALAAELQVPVASMLLPTKDLREYVRMGGTLDLLQSLEKQLVWRQPK